MTSGIMALIIGFAAQFAQRFGSHSGSRKSARRPSTRALRGLCEEERPCSGWGLTNVWESGQAILKRRAA
jgi:hypothetical protein